MAERERGGSGWLGFIAGIALLAVVALGVVAYTGGFRNQETAQLDIDAPDIDIDLPEPPPAPSMPPTADAPEPASAP